MANKLQMGKRRSVLLAAALVFVGAVITALGWYIVSINPLPSDEEMIAHFKTHREDIEELMTRYREFRRPTDEEPRHWAAIPEIRELLKSAEIRDVSNAGPLWFPDPYSIEAARKKEALLRSKQSFDIGRQYGGILLRPSDQRYFTKSLRYLTDFAIWKDFYFLPEVPKIEGGILFGPMSSDGTSNPRYRLFASLDKYPPNWKRGECVLRQIETQWFIQMCRAA